MDFRRVILVGLALALPLSAVAKPVYLKCKTDSSDPPFDVTVDEEIGRVVHSDHPVYDKAGFTSSEITYQRDIRFGGSTMTQKYVIDRTNLSYRSVWTMWSILQNGKPKEIIATGQCEIATPPERKI
ncbi:hypothetical protein [Lysobacter enzymogenes]|uniref:hypothetical protein n=1 Tax=Lysobacter enzymogenes TaxID=69 RepID=UPI0008981328|nr:hypothetical protein [Lysobacter enzymogenes]SDW95237.1 hypothetical protein SAMN05421681_103318 [Lysobacter enzymogenes]